MCVCALCVCVCVCARAHFCVRVCICVRVQCVCERANKQNTRGLISGSRTCARMAWVWGGAYDDVTVALVVCTRQLEVARLGLIDGAHVVAQIKFILDRE